MEPGKKLTVTPAEPPPDLPANLPSALTAKWVLVAGVVFGALTFLFFAGLVVVSVLGKPVPPDSRLLVVAVLAIGIALSASFLGGTASASGKLPLPGGMNPVSFGVAGGVAVFVIVFLVGSLIYVRTGSDTVTLAGSVLDADGNVGIPRATITIKTDTNTYDRQAADDGDFRTSDIPNLFNRQVTVSAKAENYMPADPQTILIGSYLQQFKFELHNCYNGVWHETDNYHQWPPGTKGNQWRFQVTGADLHIFRIDGFVSGDFHRRNNGSWSGELSWGNDQKTPGMILNAPNAQCNQIITNQFWSYARDTSD